MSAKEVMGAAIGSLIEHMSSTPNLNRLSVAYLSEDDSRKDEWFNSSGQRDQKNSQKNVKKYDDDEVLFLW